LSQPEPKHHVRRLQAYFPSVVAMDDGEMLALIVRGEGFEATSLQTFDAIHRGRELVHGRADLRGPWTGTTEKIKAKCRECFGRCGT
jgi:hypothetical protein